MTCVRLLLLLAFIVSAGAFAAEPPNLAPNPGFENLDDTGWPEGWKKGLKSYSVSTEDPRSGEHCLKWVNDDPSRYDLCSIPVTGLQPGKRYEIGGWVRTSGLAGGGTGATFCIEFWQPDGGFISGAYPVGVKGDTPEWRKISGITGRVPADANVNLLAYCRKGHTGTAWFDDLFIRPYQGPLVESLVTSLYRGLAADGNVRARMGLNLLDYDLAPADVMAVLEITDAGGKCIRRIAATEVTHESANFEFTAADLPVGDYVLVARAATKGGRLRGLVAEALRRGEALAETRSYIDQHGRLILDGEPFFPLGTYWNTVRGHDSSLVAEHLDIYADSAFNCIMPYDSWNVDTPQLDLAHERGIKIIYSVKDFFAGRRGLKTEDDAREHIRNIVNRYKDHPAIMAWYINDELPHTMYEQLRAHQLWMEEFDPTRPTWVVLYQVNDVDKYLGTFDVIGTDPYPIPGRVARAWEYADKTRRAVQGLKPIWMVPQIFNWGSYRTRKDGKYEDYPAPSLDEMRSMAWQCICAGARGLIFYSWMDLWRMDQDTGEKFTDRWPDIRLMAQEIADLSPVLLSIDRPAQLNSSTVPGDVVYRLFARDGATYLCAVNIGEEPLNATFDFAEEFSTCDTLVGRDTVDFSGARVRIRFGGTEAKVIRLSP